MGKKYICILALFCQFVFADYYIRNTPQQVNGSYNSLAATGLIQLPTADLKKSGIVGVTIGNSSLNKYASIIASPFDWLEASFYYHRPRDTKYIKVGNYLDKGFNIKIVKRFSNISIAMGIDDIAGTGIFTKEYLVGTLYAQGFNLTLGIGTGELSRDHPYKNPMPGFKERPANIFTPDRNTGSEVDINRIFKGPIGIFGGLEYAFKDIKGLTLKIESNPFDYKKFMAGGSPTDKSKSARIKSKDFNIGLSYKFLEHYNLSLSQIKGNSYDLVLSRSFNLAKKSSKRHHKTIKKYSQVKDVRLAFYQDLLRNLEQDELYLQSADLNDGNLKVAVVNNQYNIPQDLFMRTHQIATEISKLRKIEVSQIDLTHIVSGIETGIISAPSSHPLNRNKPGKVTISQAKNETQDHEFQTVLNFPEFYYSIKPSFNYRYADPTRFFAGGIDLMINSEIKFSPSFYTTANFSYQLYNSFERLRYYPDSPYLPHVRTDVVKYLNNRPDLYLNNLQIDKITKLKKNHYFKLSAGMYEMMFGGFGAEYLWKPFYENYSVGINLYRVKQRDFKQQVGFSDYKTVTGHINFLYLHQKSGIYLDLSVGQYLAKDRGYTFDIGRKFRSGAKMGAYFTRTNISKKVYGEGSFDKGFYFKVPLKFLDQNAPRGDSLFLIQPLTRDGGAKLKTSNPLIYSIYGGSKIEHDFFDN
jgi:hypothetical protein